MNVGERFMILFCEITALGIYLLETLNGLKP